MGHSRSLNRTETPARRNYRRTFDIVRDRVRLLQSIGSCAASDHLALDAAVLELEWAWTEHREARDAVLREMGRAPTLPVRPEEPTTEDRVRNLAELLWEFEGRQEGSALDDWYRAENILRRSSMIAV